MTFWFGNFLVWFTFRKWVPKIYAGKLKKNLTHFNLSVYPLSSLPWRKTKWNFNIKSIMEFYIRFYAELHICQSFISGEFYYVLHDWLFEFCYLNSSIKFNIWITFLNLIVQYFFFFNLWKFPETLCQKREYKITQSL